MNEATDGDLLVLRERKRALDTVWLFTLTVAFLAVAVPWFLRALEIDLAPVAWGLFSFALIYLLAAFGTDKLRRRGALVAAMGLAQLFGFLVLSAVWHLSGGLFNPAFLLVFTLPVMAGAVVLPRWPRHASAPFAVALVLAVAWMESSDLRWYALKSGLPVEWLADLLPELSRAGEPFPSLQAPPSYHFVICLVFAGALPALALVARALAEVAARYEPRRPEQREADLDERREG